MIADPQNVPDEINEPEDEKDTEGYEIAQQIIEDARDWVEREIWSELEHAWRYYNKQVDAEPFWKLDTIDSESGEPVYEGSSVVDSVCWDAVQAALPEIYRVFTASREAVQFLPGGGEDVELAEQATAYSNHVWRANAGEDMLNTSLINYLLKFAAHRVSWQAEDEDTSFEFTGYDEATLQALAEDDSIIQIEAEPRTEKIAVMQVDPMTGQQMPAMAPMTVYDGYVVRRETKGQIAIESVPQYEFVIDGHAKSTENARCVGQRGKRVAADVIALGIDMDTVLQYAGADSEDAAETIERETKGHQTQESETGTAHDMDPSLSFVEYGEYVIRMDRDGDGVTECYLAIALGEQNEVVSLERRDDVHYIVDSPFERPGSVIGEGLVEVLVDLQDQKTALLRASLNNFNRANNPREVVTGQDDRAIESLQSIFGGPIETEPGTTITWHVTPYIADRSYPLMQFLDGRTAARTGISQASQGLDPDVLKGQTVDGARKIVEAPQSRIEYIVRRYAIGIMRPLFRCILRLSVQHQDRPTVVRMRGKWVSVQPDAWNADMDCEPKVGLGSGSRAEKLTALNLVAEKQEQLLLAGSPLVSLQEYRRTLGEMAEVVGLKNDEDYFKELSEEELAQIQQQAQQQQQTQAMQALQAEAAKMQAEQAAKTQGKLAELQAKHASEMEQMQAELQGRLVEIDAQHRDKLELLRQEFMREIALMRGGAAAGNGNIRRVGA